jgi:hypothetical protein
MGVKYADMFTTRLEQLLNAAADRFAPGKSFEVIACGVPAYGTAQERWLYETRLTDYQAQVVLVMAQNTDHEGVQDRLHDQQYATPRPWERIFLTPLIVRNLLHLTAPVDYRGVALQMRLLDEGISRSGGRLAVAIFQAVDGAYQIGSKDRAWRRGRADLFETLKEALAGTRVPLVDLTSALYGGRSVEELMIYPADLHPNELVHRAVAAELLNFLEQNSLLRPGHGKFD